MPDVTTPSVPNAVARLRRELVVRNRTARRAIARAVEIMEEISQLTGEPTPYTYDGVKLTIRGSAGGTLAGWTS